MFDFITAVAVFPVLKIGNSAVNVTTLSMVLRSTVMGVVHE